MGRAGCSAGSRPWILVLFAKCSGSDLFTPFPSAPVPDHGFREGDDHGGEPWRIDQYAVMDTARRHVSHDVGENHQQVVDGASVTVRRYLYVRRHGKPSL